ncbi:hypothetical protein LJR232_003125 [Aquipseudomonas alcaligenes]
MVKFGLVLILLSLMFFTCVAGWHFAKKGVREWAARDPRPPEGR